MRKSQTSKILGHLTLSKILSRKNLTQGCLGDQSVKRLTLHFGSAHNLTVCGIEPHSGPCADSMEPAWDRLSLSLCSSLTCAVSVSLKIKKNKKKEKNEKA